MAREAVTIQDVLRGATAPIDTLGVTETLAEQMSRLTNQLERLQGSGAVGGDAVKGNTRSASESSSKADAIRSALSPAVVGAVGLGLGVSPLIAGIARLFGRGDRDDVPPALVKFGLPDSLHVSAGVSAALPGPAFAVDYAQGGLPRPVTAPTQITVQVQAMDSQSFLDHSGEIAMAVRQAMLESSVLNDVIRGA
jgi:hypothetical protein